MSLRIANKDVDKSASSGSVGLGGIHDKMQLRYALYFLKPQELDRHFQVGFVGVRYRPGGSLPRKFFEDLDKESGVVVQEVTVGFEHPR